MQITSFAVAWAMGAAGTAGVVLAAGAGAPAPALATAAVPVAVPDARRGDGPGLPEARTSVYRRPDGAMIVSCRVAGDDVPPAARPQVASATARPVPPAADRARAGGLRIRLWSALGGAPPGPIGGRLRRVDGGAATPVVRADGTLDFGGVPAGTYVLEAHGGDGATLWSGRTFDFHYDGYSERLDLYVDPAPGPLAWG